MFKKIPYTANYEMSIEGQIRRTNGEPCQFTTIDGIPHVTLFIYNEEKTLPLEWLKLITHFEVELPYKHFFEVTFIEGKQWRFSNSVNKLMIFKKGYVTYGRLFRIVPNLTRYAVSQTGIVADTKNNSIIKHVIVENKYNTVCIYDPDKGKLTNKLVHRLVALAWVKNPNPKEFYMVNHIDGNKHNCHSDNLEWTNYKGNIEHAYNNLLRLDNKRCLVRNTITGEIKEFVTYASAAKYMGVRKPVLTLHLKRTPTKLIKGVYEVKTNNSSSEWIHEISGENVGSEACKILITKEDNVKENLYGLKKISQYFGIRFWNTKALERYLNKLKQEKGIDYHFESLESSTKKIQSYNVNSKEIKTHIGIRTAARELGVTRHLIKTALANGEMYCSQGYAFRYYTKKRWITNFKEYQNAVKSILAIHKTGKEKQCKSIRDAITQTGVNGKAIKRNLEGERINFDWTFQYS